METTGALKGHGFSRAAKSIKQQPALAPEGSILLPSKIIPQGPDSFPSTFLGTDEAIPFQNKLPYRRGTPCMMRVDRGGAAGLLVHGWRGGGRTKFSFVLDEDLFFKRIVERVVGDVE